MAEAPLVLITGVTGFIGCQTLYEFLLGEGKGKYRLRGTVRDPSKIEPLKEFLGDALTQVEIVQADLLNQESIDKAVQGCDYVVHTASPVVIENSESPHDYIEPAVNGTKYVLESALKHKVKRVVITSSVAACIVKKAEGAQDESDWTDETNPLYSSYIKSKTIAEKWAWNFKKQNPDAPEIVTILPSLTIGEVPHKAATSSLTLIEFVMKNKHQMTETFGTELKWFRYVDIVDVRLAHLRALERSEAANQRFIVTSGSEIWGPHMSDIVEEYLTEKGIKHNVKRQNLEEPKETDIPVLTNNSRSKEILGLKYKRSVKEIFGVCALDFIKHKIVEF